MEGHGDLLQHCGRQRDPGPHIPSFTGLLDAPSEERRPSKAKNNRLSLKSTIRSLATIGKDTTDDK
jgi:hypothetical protein